MEPQAEYGKPLSGKPRVVSGVTFRPYRRGVLLYVWVSDCGRFKAFCNHHRSTYGACVDGEPLRPRFRSMENAMKAAIAKAEGNQ